MIKRKIKHFHLCCGLGGGAKGFNAAKPRVGNTEAEFVCLGGIDVDPKAIGNFNKLAGVPGTVMDLFTLDQYRAFHGNEPPPGWREASPADVRAAAQNQDPDVVFISSPCKGASGLLSEAKSKSEKYQALNGLTLRCIWLMLEAWRGAPVKLLVFENVPRLMTRGRHLLDQIGALLRHHGYAVQETTHDCGELGGLAQSRKRMLLVARHIEQVPAFLYQPDRKRLAPVGDVLGRMLMPGDHRAGPMHRVPALQWKTWVRLAFVEAGKDWRSLQKLEVADGYLKDFLIVPDSRHNDYLGVIDWHEHAGAISGRGTPTTGAYSVADPRFDDGGYNCGQYGICGWDEPMGAVINVKSPRQGTFAVQDPRLIERDNRQNNIFKVVHYNHAAGTITSGSGPTSGGQAVADPRGPVDGFGKYLVTPWSDPSLTVIAGSTTGQGAFAVADPRPGFTREKGDNYYAGGHYGVIPWESHSGAISSSANHDSGRFSVADPRKIALPAADQKTIAIIRALDGTWHRPFTTLELAALQSLIDPEEVLHMDGLSDSEWREQIGNAVPAAAAEAIAGVMGTTLILAAQGETFSLSSVPIWVRPVAVALALAGAA